MVINVVKPAIISVLTFVPCSFSLKKRSIVEISPLKLMTGNIQKGPKDKSPGPSLEKRAAKQSFTCCRAASLSNNRLLLYGAPLHKQADISNAGRVRIIILPLFFS